MIDIYQFINRVQSIPRTYFIKEKVPQYMDFSLSLAKDSNYLSAILFD